MARFHRIPSACSTNISHPSEVAQEDFQEIMALYHTVIVFLKILAFVCICTRFQTCSSFAFVHISQKNVTMEQTDVGTACFHICTVLSEPK